MTREEAIKWIEYHIAVSDYAETDNLSVAFRMAIEALSTDPCEDAISRARVVEWLHNCTDDSIEHAIDSNIEFIPSVTPKVSECEDAISRKSVIDVLVRNRVHFCDVLKITSELKELPSATPKQKMGRWIDTMGDEYETYCVYKCSECGQREVETPESIGRFKFCPNCGAKMAESEE